MLKSLSPYLMPYLLWILTEKQIKMNRLKRKADRKKAK